MRQVLNITVFRRKPPERCLLIYCLIFLLIFPGFGSGGAAQACPATLFNTELAPALTGPRVNVKLFAWSDGEGSVDGKKEAGWHLVPFQLDPIDEDGFLMFFKDGSYIRDPIGKNDVIIFNVDQFGRKVDLRRHPLPCKSAVTFQLYDLIGKKYAYLSSCEGPQEPEFFLNQVSFNSKENYLESDTYRYKFNDTNYMLFKEISYRNDAGDLSPVAWDSDMLIKADVKRFFTMRFDSKDIVSRLEESRLGPVANLARVSFFLRILFFKIRMSLNTDVGFFRESGHIPMMINIPVNSSEYLNPKSGILYSWQQTPQAVYQSTADEMPAIDTGLIGEGYKKLGEAGMKYCRGSDCRFKYRVDINGRLLSMDLGIRKELVARGFYPLFVSDVAKFQKEMGWSDKYETAKNRTGLYFEVSGLEKGGHPWDFWMRLGGTYNKFARCPAMVFISKPKI